MSKEKDIGTFTDASGNTIPIKVFIDREDHKEKRSAFKEEVAEKARVAKHSKSVKRRYRKYEKRKKGKVKDRTAELKDVYELIHKKGDNIMKALLKIKNDRDRIVALMLFWPTISEALVLKNKLADKKMTTNSISDASAHFYGTEIPLKSVKRYVGVAWSVLGQDNQDGPRVLTRAREKGSRYPFEYSVTPGVGKKNYKPLLLLVKDDESRRTKTIRTDKVDKGTLALQEKEIASLKFDLANAKHLITDFRVDQKAHLDAIDDLTKTLANEKKNSGRIEGNLIASRRNLKTAEEREEVANKKIQSLLAARDAAPIFPQPPAPTDGVEKVNFAFSLDRTGKVDYSMTIVNK